LVDFGKLLGKERPPRSSDPIEIFKNLDKQSGKEYLRPPQEAVLKEWYSSSRKNKDVIVKLHTGQGKTLIGLLALQSYLNDGKGPAVYLCPNSYLVTQTVEQAEAFDIKVVEFEDTRPPQAFLNSDAILVATCNKLFNGKSVFGIAGSGRDPIHVGAIVVDDAHKCLDIIRDSFSVVARRQTPEGKNNPVYERLWNTFEESLTRQAPGTCADIKQGLDCVLAVPFWSWYDKRAEALKILSDNKESADVVFVWDLIKDLIDKTVCNFSGARVEITPRLLPMDLIPSFSKASHRIFLSATLNEDAFLVRDLGIEPDCVSKPLTGGDTKYSGERMILLPSLVDTTLKRERIISWITSLATKNGDFGVVTIVPSFGSSRYWESLGAEVVGVRDIHKKIEELRARIKSKDAKRVIVLVNEYDGVDLPDNTCRILCLDSLPSYETLMDRYVQEMRPDSWVTRRKLAQRVEQGMGRAIRGINDWCIVVVAGNNLTDFLSEQNKRTFLSKEAQMQIRIAEELVAELKKEVGI
jgi:replicative superfamily II helicase